MALTPAQEATLVADIAADPVLNKEPHNADGAAKVADAYNEDADPEYWVYKTLLTWADASTVQSPDGTDFDWQEYMDPAKMSQVERDTLGVMFAAGGANDPSLDPSRPNVQQGLQDIFPAGSNNRAHILSTGRCKASRVERLFVKRGTGPPNNPDTRDYVGPLHYRDVLKAWKA